MSHDHRAPWCWPFSFSCARKRSRKDHFQSINLKAVENISQLHLVVPMLEIPASKMVSAVQRNWKCQPEKPQQPQSTELLLARKYCGLN